MGQLTGLILPVYYEHWEWTYKKSPQDVRDAARRLAEHLRSVHPFGSVIIEESLLRVKERYLRRPSSCPGCIGAKEIERPPFPSDSHEYKTQKHIQDLISDLAGRSKVVCVFCEIETWDMFISDPVSLRWGKYYTGGFSLWLGCNSRWQKPPKVFHVDWHFSETVDSLTEWFKLLAAP